VKIEREISPHQRVNKSLMKLYML